MVAYHEGGSTGKNLFWLPKGHLWGQEERLYRVAPRPPELLIILPNQGLLVSSPEENQGQPALLKKPAVHLVHLEEEDTSDDEDPESDDSGRIEEVTEEFMVHLARSCKGCPSRWEMLLPL